MPVSGFGGHISKGAVGGGSEAAIGCVREWSFSESSGIATPVCADAVIAYPGRRDGTITYGAYGGTPAVMPGDELEFEGAIVGDDEEAIGLTADAICTEVTVNFPIESGEPLNHTVSMAVNGTPAHGTVTVDADETTPAPYPTMALATKIAASTPWSSFVAIADVSMASFTISRGLSTYGSSHTGGWNRHGKGPLSARASITAYAADADAWASFPARHTIVAVQMFTTATAFWLFKYMLVEALSDCSVNREGPNTPAGTISLVWSSYNHEASPGQGSIVLPSTSEWWPGA